MHLGFFPRGRFKRLQGQRFERGLFRVLENFKRFLARGAVYFQAIGFQTPGARVAIGARELQVRIQRFAFAKELAHHGHGAFDFRFVFGMIGPRRINETTIMLRQLLIRGIEVRQIQIRFEHTGFEIIDDHALGHAFKELEHAQMRAYEVTLVLLINKLHELEPAIRQRGDESINVALAPAKDRQLNNFLICSNPPFMLI